jgi:cytochrome bd-type quinol oxidase subunit 1
MVFILAEPDAAVPERVARLLLTAYLATALLVASVAAWRLMRNPQRADSSLALRMAIGMFVACAPLEIAMDAAPGLRVGLALGGAILIVGLWGGFLTWRSAPERSRMYLGACLALAPTSVFYAAAGWAMA